MDTTLVTSPAFIIGGHAFSAAAAFLSALLLSSALRMNKGAKANAAWSFVALGFILIGVSETSRAAEGFGLALLKDWDGILTVAALLAMAIGVVLWRSVVKKALS